MRRERSPDMDWQALENAFAAFDGALRGILLTQLGSVWLPIQLGIIVAAAAAALTVATLVRKRFDLVSATMSWPPYLRLAVRAVMSHLGSIVFIVLLWIVRTGMHASMELPRTYLLLVAINLASAWVVIDILASVIRNQFINRVVAVSVWTIAALSILRLLDPIVAGLDSITLNLGGLRITPLVILKATVVMVLLVWAATAASNFLDRQIRGFSDLTPSIQVLLGKLIRIALISFAIIIGLSSVGIDISVLALFTGAVGVGLGFGLQKIVSNLVSGIILLADKSIKPGDIISVGDQFGWVTTMGARYTAVNTRDGREYLVPNEDFVTQRVVNWTYTDNLIRLEVKFGATYTSDPRKVQAAAVAAASGVARVLKYPAPVCHLLAFNPGTVEYRLAFWIGDPAAGITAVRSDVMLALWDTLEKEGIGLPKPGPQRVIYEHAKGDAESLPPAR
jgi:small-conductance mechanosensitive channel